MSCAVCNDAVLCRPELHCLLYEHLYLRLTLKTRPITVHIMCIDLYSTQMVCHSTMNASQRVRPHRSYDHSRAEQLNTSCMPYSSNVHHASPGLGLHVPSGLGRMVLRVILLLLVLSGDIESNPGPVGEISGLLYVTWLCVLKFPLHHMCDQKTNV